MCHLKITKQKVQEHVLQSEEEPVNFLFIFLNLSTDNK